VRRYDNPTKLVDFVLIYFFLKKIKGKMDSRIRSVFENQGERARPNGELVDGYSLFSGTNPQHFGNGQYIRGCHKRWNWWSP